MPENDPGDVQDDAARRQRERAERVEDVLAETESLESLLDEAKYPVTSEELATEYGDQEIDLANETESLGSVFDRLAGEEFESSEEAREAIYGEITGEASRHGEVGQAEYNEERDLQALADEADEREDADAS
ncbi:DUF5789 family protein [Halegenticoccus tardaugens]|uniref:DUF5789 family protein n=1 Tax=Halegenticoccus tardaugens TaxID=2071624 RepID=UPI00100B6480|nr:hypothetical protein [Halegenticoccus tardaugens]